MRILSKTFLLVLIIAILPAISIADDYEPLNRAENLLNDQKERTLFAARRVDKAHSKMTALGGKYDSSESAIAAGNTRTVAAAFGVTLTAFATGGQSVAWSGIVSAVTSAGMTAAEKRAALTAIGGMSLVDAYESAIIEKESAINNFNGQFVNYQIDWQVWSAVYNQHYNWDTHEGAGSQGSTHQYHSFIDDFHIDTSLPSFPCGGNCGNNFITPTSDHWTRCGTSRETIREEVKRRFGFHGAPRGAIIVVQERQANPSRGCGKHYYNCRDEAQHIIRYCQKTRKYYNDSGTQIIIETCGDPYRRCLRHPSPSKGIHTTPPSPPSPPTYHACGTHETTVSGNHEAASCGISGHYQCDGSDHSYVSCPTDSNGQSCDYGSYYSCSPHTHAYPSVDNTPDCSYCTDGCSTCQPPSNDEGGGMVMCEHCDEEYDPNDYDASEHTKVWTCGSCGDEFISCQDEACSSSPYGYHNP